MVLWNMYDTETQAKIGRSGMRKGGRGGSMKIWRRWERSATGTYIHTLLCGCVVWMGESWGGFL